MSVVGPTALAQVLAACLAIVLGAAAALKLRSQEPFRQSLIRLGIPERGSRIAVGAGIATELLAGVLLLAVPVAGGALTCGLFLAFALARLRSGSASEGCGCLGSLAATSRSRTEMWCGIALRLAGASGGGFVVASDAEANGSLVSIVSVGVGLGLLVLWLGKRRAQLPSAIASQATDPHRTPPGGWSRRSFLARATLVFGAAMASQLLGIPRRVPAAAAAAGCPLCRGATAKCNY